MQIIHRTRAARWLIAAAAVTLTTLGALADEVVIRNDSLENGGSGCIIGDFVPGEEAAVWLTAPQDGAIVAIQVLWWSNDNRAEPTIERNIWVRKSGAFPEPGETLLQLEAPQLTPFFLNEFRFVDENNQIPINVPVESGETVVVSVEYANRTDIRNGSPSIVRDIDGCRARRNGLYALPPFPFPGWYDWCRVEPQVCGGAKGDFAIRVVLEQGDVTRSLDVESDVPGSLVQVDDEPQFRETPFSLDGLTEGDRVLLTADRFSPEGDQFVHWKLDGRVETDSRELLVIMNSGDDRVATAIYHEAIARILAVRSNAPGARVDPGTGFRVTPFDLNDVFEGDEVSLRAFPVSPEGEPFVRWDVDGEPATENLTVVVQMDAGRDRTASAVYAGGGGESCGTKAKLKAVCKKGGEKVKGKLTKADPNTEVTFRVDAGDDVVKTTSGNGKAKTKWKKLDPGSHEVTVCDLADGC